MSEYVDGIKINDKMRRILRTFLDAATPLSGLELCETAELWSGTVYPQLAALEVREWLSSAWEEHDDPEDLSPRRRLYGLTPLGRTRAHAILGNYGPLAN